MSNNGYLIQKINDYVINNCFVNESHWNSVKPWWFMTPATEAIAWSVWNYSKQHGYPPSKSLIPSLIDYKKSKVTIMEIEGVLRCHEIDPMLMTNLLLTFKSYGMLWDIIVRHHDNNIDNNDFKELQHTVDVLKQEPIVGLDDYQKIIKYWKKWNGKR
jgi:hypothetical protein